MPIKGFFERKRMRRIGIVRLGIKVVSDKINPKTDKPIEYPQPTTYFVVNDAPGLAEIYGEKPKLLNILLVSDEPEIAFPYYMMRYRQRGLICMGDGDRILRKRGENGKWEVGGGVNLQTGEIEACRALECPFGIRPKKGRAECQPTGRLRFLCADNPTHGYYQLTVRKRAIEGFLGQLDFAKSVLGRITGYPWQLIMEQETVQLESGQRKLWIPQLEIEPTIFQELLRQKHAGKPLALPEGLTQATPEMDKELTEDLDYEPDDEPFPDEEETAEEAEPELVKPRRKAKAKKKAKGVSSAGTIPPDKELTTEEIQKTMRKLNSLAQAKGLTEEDLRAIIAKHMPDAGEPVLMRYYIAVADEIKAMPTPVPAGEQEEIPF